MQDLREKAIGSGEGLRTLDAKVDLVNASILQKLDKLDEKIEKLVAKRG